MEWNMVMNKNIFKTTKISKMIKNQAGGNAYEVSHEHALAQYACTGCFNATYYSTDEEQINTIVELCNKIQPEFIAKTAIYARKHGFMKDMPAILMAVLTTKDIKLFKRIFPEVINNGKMIRNFMQIMRSGIIGRKSFGTAVKKTIQKWFDTTPDDILFKQSIGNNPSMSDCIRMIHPKPITNSKNALYAYLIGKKYKKEELPQLVVDFEEYKENQEEKIPQVPFEMLTALNLDQNAWIQLALNGGWHFVRMNLNTFARHNVYDNQEVIKQIAEIIRNPKLIRQSNVFPYQLLTTYLNINQEIPLEIKEALQDAMEISLENVPNINGRVYICPDVSGSMSAPATGYRKGSTTRTRCIDVAALVAAAFIRKNKQAIVLPFATQVVDIELNPRDSVMTNATRLASIGGGGTACSAPLIKLNKNNVTGTETNPALIIFISDNESWIDSTSQWNYKTAVKEEWRKFLKNNPNSKMICIDIIPNKTVQIETNTNPRTNVINIGGFSDKVFDIINAYYNGNQEQWTTIINKIELE